MQHPSVSGLTRTATTTVTTTTLHLKQHQQQEQELQLQTPHLHHYHHQHHHHYCKQEKCIWNCCYCCCYRCYCCLSVVVCITKTKRRRSNWITSSCPYIGKSPNLIGAAPAGHGHGHQKRFSSHWGAHTGMLEYPQRFARNIPNSNSSSGNTATTAPQLPQHQNYQSYQNSYRQVAPGSPAHHQRQSSLSQQQQQSLQHHRTLSTASSCSAQHKSVTFGHNQPPSSAPIDYSNGSSSGNSSCSAAGNVGPQSMAGNMKHGKNLPPTLSTYSMLGNCFPKEIPFTWQQKVAI